MKVSFRQGIVRYKIAPVSGGPSAPTPLFLQKNIGQNAVDFVASLQEPTVVNFAHYGANYLVEESTSIQRAWGGGVVEIPGAAKDINNAALAEHGQTQYLYWDIDLATGVLRRGWTDQSLIVSPTAPSNPLNDLHWFDLSTSRMRVFKTTGSTGHWLDKIRVFAATYNQNGILLANSIGSGVGLSGGEYFAGNIILGANNKPLRQSDATFATTETQLIISQTSSQNVKFDMAVVFAQAAEEIPKFSLVSFAGDRRITLASCLNPINFVSGLVVEDLFENEVGQVITNGAVRNEQWAWTQSQINKPLFCTSTGQLTLTPTTVGVVQQVGFVFDTDAIYLNLFQPVRLAPYLNE